MRIARPAYLLWRVASGTNKHSLARASVLRLARHLCNAATVDTDRRQDPSYPDTLAEPQLACNPVCHVARTDNLTHSTWLTHLRDRVRFRWAGARHRCERRREPQNSLAAADGCRLPRRGHERARRTG